MKLHVYGLLVMLLVFSCAVQSSEVPDGMRIYGMQIDSTTQARISADQLRAGGEDVFLETKNPLAVRRVFEWLQLKDCKAMGSSGPIDARLVVDFYRKDRRVATFLINRGEIQDEANRKVCAISKEQKAGLNSLWATFVGRFE